MTGRGDEEAERQREKKEPDEPAARAASPGRRSGGATSARAAASIGIARVTALVTAACGIELTQKPARKPGRALAGRDLDRDERQEQAADEGDRRRHRQAIRQAEQDHENREGAIAQHCDDVRDSQPVARVPRQRRKDRRNSRLRKQPATGGAGGRSLLYPSRSARPSRQDKSAGQIAWPSRPSKTTRRSRLPADRRSVQRQDAADRLELGRLDQSAMGDRH